MSRPLSVQVGDRKGRVVYIGEPSLETLNSGERRTYGSFRCDCGTVYRMSVSQFRSRKHQSCGCLQREKVTTHGQSYSRMYGIWANMIHRCHSETSAAFGNYGARGITVCDEWRASFEAFLAHVGERPSPRHSLDRIDNSRGYEPGNVRWATNTEQGRNRRTNRAVIRSDGKVYPSIQDAADDMKCKWHYIWRVAAGYPSRRSAYGFGWSFYQRPREEVTLRIQVEQGL